MEESLIKSAVTLLTRKPASQQDEEFKKRYYVCDLTTQGAPNRIGIKFESPKNCKLWLMHKPKRSKKYKQALHMQLLVLCLASNVTFK